MPMFTVGTPRLVLKKYEPGLVMLWSDAGARRHGGHVNARLDLLKGLHPRRGRPARRERALGQQGCRLEDEG